MNQTVRSLKLTKQTESIKKRIKKLQNQHFRLHLIIEVVVILSYE